jgi:hypothetical protein
MDYTLLLNSENEVYRHASLPLEYTQDRQNQILEVREADTKRIQHL